MLEITQDGDHIVRLRENKEPQVLLSKSQQQQDKQQQQQQKEQEWHLDLAHTGVGPDALQALSRVPGLESLSLFGCKLGSAMTEGEGEGVQGGSGSIHQHCWRVILSSCKPATGVRYSKAHILVDFEA